VAALDGFPLPTTARHDKDGNHVPPFIAEWRAAADPTSPAYDPDRAASGREVERDQQQKALFHAHLEEHRRRGEPDVTMEDKY
jgi:hypothetical protein